MVRAEWWHATCVLPLDIVGVFVLLRLVSESLVFLFCSIHEPYGILPLEASGVSQVVEQGGCHTRQTSSIGNQHYGTETRLGLA
jgi:hypothetical protein